jgi:hypothetical protein
MKSPRERNISGRFLLLTVFLLLFLVLPARATNHFVRAGASGAGTGADWTNAFTDLPATLTRGDLYYVAAGSYKHHQFNDADSGTSLIEVRAATVADHGTATGWQDTFQGPAIFAASGSGTPAGCVFQFDTDFYLINGNGVRNADWQGGYLITADDSNGNAHNCVVMVGASANGSPGAGRWVHDITLDFIESNGSHTVTDSGVHEQGIETHCGSSNINIRHSYIHDGGSVLLFLKGKHDSLLNAGTSLCNASSTGSQLTAEFNYLARDYSSSAIHGEGVECDEGQFCVIRYNQFRDINGTAYIATPSGCGQATCNIDNQWDIYGNVFFMKNTFQDNGVTCGVGGVIQVFDVKFSGPLRFVNNTIANIKTSICANNAGIGAIFIQQGSLPAVLSGGLFVQNNLWYNNDRVDAITSSTCTTCSSITWDHNAYFSQAVGDSDPNSQIVASSNPFVSSGTDNYRLLADTTAGVSLTAPYNTDLDGTTRGIDGVWDRGAFQFDTGKRPPLPPPSVSAVVH